MNKFKIKKANIKYIAIIFLIAIFFYVDRFLKSKALLTTIENNILGPYLKFKFFANPYAAFSIPFPMKILWSLVIIGFCIVVVGMIFLLLKKRRLEFTCFFAIFCGALSNLWDRLLYGHVIDYLEMFSQSVLNLADILIFIASVILLIYYLKFDKIVKNKNI